MDNANKPANPVMERNGDMSAPLPYKDLRRGDCTGLTKREELAARAMQGLLSDPNVNPDDIFELSVMCADQLLAELEEEPNQ